MLKGLSIIPLTATSIVRDSNNKKTTPKMPQGWPTVAINSNTNSNSSIPDVAIARCDNILVLDFDTNESFAEALSINDSLNPNSQCKYIVQSDLKGGHLYYKQAMNTKLKNGSYTGRNWSEVFPHHKKQQIVDIQHSNQQCVFLPTPGNKTKTVIYQDAQSVDELTQIPLVMQMYINNIIHNNVALKTQTIVASTKQEITNMHTNTYLVSDWIKGVVSDKDFFSYYRLPIPSQIPQGGSNDWFQNFGIKLATDASISFEQFEAAMENANKLSGMRKTPDELRQTQINAFKTNGLFVHNPNWTKTTLTYRTKRADTLQLYYSEGSSEYIVHLQKQQKIYTKRKENAVDIVSAQTGKPAAEIKKALPNAQPVTLYHTFAEPTGYNAQADSFNTAVKNKFLLAFLDPTYHEEDYEEPRLLLEALRTKMLNTEFDYTLSSHKYRLQTFSFSPVITFLKGVEGSGKDVLIRLLAKPFNEEPISLTYKLATEKNTTWKQSANAVISELENWSQYEIDEMITVQKDLTGSHGKVAIRAMQKDTIVTDTYIKLWNTSNGWVKLYTDINQQRRLHVIEMDGTLSEIDGGAYTAAEIDYMFSDESVLNFYHWLGHIYTGQLSKDDYMSPKSRQDTPTYRKYLAETADPTDSIQKGIKDGDFSLLLNTFEHLDIQLSDLTLKLTKQKRFALKYNSILDVLANRSINTTKMEKDLRKFIAHEASKLDFNDGDGNSSRAIYFRNVPKEVIDYAESLNVDINADDITIIS